MATQRTAASARGDRTLDLDYATDEQMGAVALVADDLMLGSSDGTAFVAVDRADLDTATAV